MDIYFNKFEDFFLYEIDSIDSMFDIYKYLHDKRIDKIDELNIAPAFFGLVGLALLENSVTKLSKLYDNNKKTINITKYLELIEKNIEEIFERKEHKKVRADILKHRIELQQLDEKIKKLKKIRNEYLAHNNLEIIRDEMDIWKKVGLLIGDFHKLIHWISEVINEYRVIRGESYVLLENLNKYDVENVIDAITEYYKNIYNLND